MEVRGKSRASGGGKHDSQRGLGTGPPQRWGEGSRAWAGRPRGRSDFASARAAVQGHAVSGMSRPPRRVPSQPRSWVVAPHSCWPAA